MHQFVQCSSVKLYQILYLTIFSDGPEKLNISLSEESVTLMSGEQLGPMICSTECNPKCKIGWTTPKGINTNRTLYLNRATKEDGGIYQCSATHPMNTSKNLNKNISVTVICKYCFVFLYFL